MQPPMKYRELPHRSKTPSGVAFLESLNDVLEKAPEHNSHYRLEKDKYDTFVYLVPSCLLDIIYSAKNQLNS